MELLVILLCASWCISVTEQAPSYLITAPKIIRIDVKETVTVQVFEPRENVDAKIYLMNQRNMVVCSETYRVKLNHTNNFTDVIIVQILPENAKKCELTRRTWYITLAAEIPELFTTRRLVHLRLLPKPYFIFIETDKPTYKPNDTVRFQTFSLDHTMKLSSCDVKMQIWHSGSVVAEAMSFNQSSGAVCRGEVTIPSLLLGDFVIKGETNSSLYSMNMGYRKFQITEQAYRKEKEKNEILNTTINLTKTKHFFIPGAPFRILTSITYLDGSPVAGALIKITVTSEDKYINLSLEAFTDSIGELSFSFIVPENASKIYIKATTGNKADQTEESSEIVVECHEKNKPYLNIDVPNVLLYPGDIIYVTLSAFSQLDISSVHYYYYMVLNKGKLLHFERIRRSDNTSFPITVTKDMVPYFRIVAYYFTNIEGDESIVSDSLRVEVEDSCSLKFQIQPALYTDNDERDLLLSVFSEAVSDVFVQAVDSQLYGPNKDMNTLQKAFYRKDFYDFGVSYGGGQNTVEVFEDAGLRFISDLMNSTELLENATVEWKRGPLIPPRHAVEANSKHQIINPVYDDAWVWEIQKTSGKKQYRLRSDIYPPKFWKITAFSISEEGEICVVKPLILKIDDSISNSAI
ncbi:complement C4-B-like [Mustelus asterias]